MEILAQNGDLVQDRAGALVDVIEILRAGGVAVTARDLELATDAGIPEVVAVLNA